MSPLDRLGRYVRAYAGLGKLNRTTAALIDRPSELIARTFNYSGAFLQPIQVEEELASLLKDVRSLTPRAVVEIGTSMGGTLYLWTRLAQPDAIVVSIDLPGGQFGGGYSPLRTPIYRRFARERQKLHLLRADSHVKSTLEQVESLLGKEQIDLLFIDGDHTYEGVSKDWEMYSPLVRAGGLIVFHDIAGNYDTTQVKRLWDEIKTGYKYREYMAHPRGQYGLGVLFKSVVT